MPLTDYARNGDSGDLEALVSAVVEELAKEFDPLTARAQRERVRARAGELISQVAATRGLFVPTGQRLAVIESAVSRVAGYGFLDELLPPKRTDLIEIAVNPDGTVWMLPKSGQRFERLDVRPTPEEVMRVLDAIFGPQGRALSEATPDVDGRLPRTPDNPGGGRVKALHPVLVGGGKYPSVSIRLFEPKAVRTEQLVRWGAGPAELFADLVAAVRANLRVMVGGGTATGKTTLLSAIANDGIARDERVIKIEDPEEIFLDLPNVVTIEARHAPPGSVVKPYTIADGVNAAMRMRPDRLIVGEVRTGDAALALFRAQMSDHPGLTTFHAESPQAAVHRLSVIMFADAGVRIEAAKNFFCQAVDVYVQLGYDERGQRRVLGVWEVAPELRGGDVAFNPIWTREDGTWKKVGEFTRRRR
ncbi:MAG: ATPase, T2SS/T4P/T4SS family [Armatimonadota bacterium]|nr:ATPase, T2SS/T4P/T4SS family [Armatimonadota bacterium]